MDWGYVAGFFDGEGTAGIYEEKTKRPGWYRAELSWGNTNLESLERIRDFIQRGKVSENRRHKVKPHYKTMYYLKICDREGILHVAPMLLRYSIVKREALIRIIHFFQNRENQHKNYGKVAMLGMEEVRRLYWDEKKSHGAIAQMLGVAESAVKRFMMRYNIPIRSRTEANLLRDKTTEAWKERNRKISESRKRDWKSSEYREMMQEKMKEGHERKRQSQKTESI